MRRPDRAANCIGDNRMTIDADLLAYYAKVAAAFPELPADADPIAMRQQFQSVAREFAAPRPAGVDVEDLALPLDGRTLRTRVYRPAGRSEERRVGKECRSRWS